MFPLSPNHYLFHITCKLEVKVVFSNPKSLMLLKLIMPIQNLHLILILPSIVSGVQLWMKSFKLFKNKVLGL